MHSTHYYPAAPIDTRPLRPSAEFKKEVAKVTGAIVLFFVVYVLLLVAAVLLAIGCCFLSIKLLRVLRGTYALLGALGILAVGGSIIFFLVKFIFSKTKQENDSRVEITESAHPELFAFVRRLAKDTGTRFPKKIFISPSVNAAVFYNSSFWSMFFPVRKNLEIGLGLVNTVNLSEFKAVMAHEFGHFSQKSMKLGSFTYNVNHVIYNLLYENDSYQQFLSSWGNLHGVLSVFAYITVAIAQGIQSILKGMYQLINKQYFGLSRQMEFNADAIAATVAGSNNLISALNRLDLSSDCYDVALQKADNYLKARLVSKNIFSNQRCVMHATATELQLTQAEGLPQVTRQFLNSFGRSRVNYKNQWASHPTNEEREAALEQLNLPATTDTRSAWILFNNPDAVQQGMTKHIYRQVPNTGDMQQYDERLFEQQYNEETEKYRLPQVFKRFYKRRYIAIKDWALDDILQDTTDDKIIEQVLSGTNFSLPEKIRNNERDLEIVQAIKDKRIAVKSFDFDGEKYDAASAELIAERLTEEIERDKQLLAQLDKQLSAAFYHRACKENKADATALQQLYDAYQHIYKYEESFTEIASKIINTIAPLYGENSTLEQVQSAVRMVKLTYEPALKAKLKAIMEDSMIAPQLPATAQEEISLFSNSQHQYFANGKFMNNELDNLYNICTHINATLNEIKYAAYKQLLYKQAALLD